MCVLAWGLPEIPIPNDSWGVFTVVLIALIIFIWAVARLVSRVTEDSDPAETDQQMLTAINDLHRKGDLSQEEFRSIKGRLVTRLRRASWSVDGGTPVGRKDDEGESGRRVRPAESVATEIQDTIVDSVTRSDWTSSADSSSGTKITGSEEPDDGQ